MILYEQPCQCYKYFVLVYISTSEFSASITHACALQMIRTMYAYTMNLFLQYYDWRQKLQNCYHTAKAKFVILANLWVTTVV